MNLLLFLIQQLELSLEIYFRPSMMSFGELHRDVISADQPCVRCVCVCVCVATIKIALNHLKTGFYTGS